MSKEKKVIDPSNLPTKLPLQLTLVVYLCLHHFEANEYVYGGVTMFLIVFWVGAIQRMIKQKKIDVLKDNE